MKTAIVTSPSARAVKAAPVAELWPDKIDVRDSNGYLWKTIPQTKARELVSSGVAEAVGRISVKYVRLKCALTSTRNDANRTTQRVRNDWGTIIAPRLIVEHRIRLE